MSQAFSNVWQNIKGDPISTAATGAGFLGNWLANRHFNSVQDRISSMMDAYRKLTPEQIASGIQALNQPLSTALTKSVGNTVQGNLAERGLATAPGIYAQVLAQALAPFAQQNLQLATQAYFQGKQLPLQAQYPWGSVSRPPGADLSGLVQKIMAGKNSTPPPMPDINDPIFQGMGTPPFADTGLTFPLPNLEYNG